MFKYIFTKYVDMHNAEVIMSDISTTLKVLEVCE